MGLPKMIAVTCYVVFVDETPVARCAVSTRPGFHEAQTGRLVVMPEWQGIGLGIEFLKAICQAWRADFNRCKKPKRMIGYTSHPGFAEALRRRPHWVRISARLFGGNKRRAAKSLSIAMARIKGPKRGVSAGYGGHFRSVQNFRYLGEEN